MKKAQLSNMSIRAVCSSGDQIVSVFARVRAIADVFGEAPEAQGSQRFENSLQAERSTGRRRAVPRALRCAALLPAPPAAPALKDFGFIWIIWRAEQFGKNQQLNGTKHSCSVKWFSLLFHSLERLEAFWDRERLT